MKAHFFRCLAFLLVIAGTASAQERKYDPTSAYEKQSIEGFTVLVNRRVLAQPRDADETLLELQTQLKEIARVVPSGPLAALRKVTIWVEWNKREREVAEFHPSAGWLEANGYNPEKVGGIEIANSRNFVHASRLEQPSLAEGRLYDEVEHVRGGRRRAWALLNEKEYFAELTEAYFGKNDFYPFTRADLEKHDPAGYRLLEQLWSRLPTTGL